MPGVNKSRLPITPAEPLRFVLRLCRLRARLLLIVRCSSCRLFSPHFILEGEHRSRKPTDSFKIAWWGAWWGRQRAWLLRAVGRKRLLPPAPLHSLCPSGSQSRRCVFWFYSVPRGHEWPPVRHHESTQTYHQPEPVSGVSIRVPSCLPGLHSRCQWETGSQTRLGASSKDPGSVRT